MTLPRQLKLCLAALWLAASMGAASAQEVNAGDMVAGALQALQMVDQNQTGELWDGAAPVARKRVTRSDFIGQVAKVREPMGVVQQRTWVAVKRQVLNDADPEVAGQYVSVEYESRFASKPDSPVRETVSFHFDGNRVWRFSGYFLRQP